jgi:hypothetical protein
MGRSFFGVVRDIAWRRRGVGPLETDVKDRELISDPDRLFSRNYNRKPFQFNHGLKGNPLFEKPALIELVKRMPDHRDTYWTNGKNKVGSGWRENHPLSIVDTIAGIETNDSLALVKHVEQDPIHGPILREFLSRVVEYAGEPMRRDVAVEEVLIIIGSPNQITPYHLDGECNYVVQIAGDKTLHVFDQHDPEIIQPEMLEGFHSGNPSSAAYREVNQAKAQTYDLVAGTGVHIPLYAPHWVQNRNNVSIALSVTFELHSARREASVYWLNRRLRKFGLHPAAPGVSPWRDGAKARVAKVIAAAKSKISPKPSTPYPIWTP